MLKQLLLTVFAGIYLLCPSSERAYTKKEITRYAQRLGIAPEELYYIKPELQEQYHEIGQPNSKVIRNSNNQVLKIATCYEEYPYYMDKFYEYRTQLKDTMQLYDTKFKKTARQMLDETVQDGEKISLDPTKKYCHIYYFARYAEFKDKERLPGALKKYRDSIQYIFINVDKLKE